VQKGSTEITVKQDGKLGDSKNEIEREKREVVKTMGEEKCNKRSARYVTLSYAYLHRLLK
jgi:hypothetical protein